MTGNEIIFQVDGKDAQSYLASPPGSGPGVLVLHAWWGLTPFFKKLCDRLAEEGFVAFAPDLLKGRTALTYEQADEMLAERDPDWIGAVVTASVSFLKSRPEVHGAGLGAVGFSLGASWSLALSTMAPDSLCAAVLFYGVREADFSAARAAFLGHYGEDDPWTKVEDAQQLENALREVGRETHFYIYPGAGHWFFESDRQGYYQPAAAQFAWDRTLKFLHENLDRPD